MAQFEIPELVKFEKRLAAIEEGQRAILAALKPPTPDKLLTIKEACAMFNISQPNFYRKRDDLVETVKLGGNTIRYRIKEGVKA